MGTMVCLDLRVWNTTVCLKQTSLDEARRITRRIMPMLLLINATVDGDVQHWVYRLNYRSLRTWQYIAETLRDKALRRLGFK